MGFLGNRIAAIARYSSELVRYGTPEFTEPLDQEVIVLLCGVGRSHFSASILRRVLRDKKTPIGTILIDWQFGLPGEIWTDLMCYRRNRVMGAQMARRIASFKRKRPQAKLHIFAYSGGCGVAVFGLESMRGRHLVETLVLAAPAMNPTYNLAPALRSVRRAYALASSRDRFLLGIGTRIFGTTDRTFTQAAGRHGFRIPTGLSNEEEDVYSRLLQIQWTISFKADGHYGGHTGWCNSTWLSRHILPILRGEPVLPTHAPGWDKTA